MMEHYAEERHDDPDERPLCKAAGWCCECKAHPIGKPWGWNARNWDKHYMSEHKNQEHE